MKEKQLKVAADSLFEVIGSFLIAMGVYNFALTADFPMSGFSGLAMIAYRLWGIPIGWTTILLNVPVSFLCFKMLGTRFFMRSLRCMVISSLMVDYIAPLFPVYTGERMLAAICTGVLLGTGYAMIYMRNSSTAGMDFITMSLRVVKPHILLGKLAFGCDFVIVALGGIVLRDMDGVIYGLIINFFYATVVDKVMYGINAGKLTLIVTKYAQEVSKAIDDCCGRGTTQLAARGGYQGEEKQVVMCACSNKQMYLVEKAVRQIEPEAFVIIMESNEVIGEGFQKKL